MSLALAGLAFASCVAINWWAQQTDDTVPTLFGWAGGSMSGLTSIGGVVAGAILALVTEHGLGNGIGGAVRGWGRSRRFATRGAVPIAVRAVLEESVWRGVVLVGISVLAHWVIAVGVSAVLFGVWHVSRGFRAVSVTIILGLVFGMLFIATGLLSAIASHATYNYCLARFDAGRILERKAP